ncbi:MAG: TAXI family TRAP transporter solute-binding subunit [Hyphomicrobiaceae bacterium]|jgi:TRAP transporter TAXI family solute receptor
MKAKSILVLALGVTVAAGVALAQQAKQLSIATGGTGGIYYPLAGGFGTILGKTIPGMTATAEVTGGSVDNLKLIAAGSADVAFTQVDTAVDAINGTAKFPSKLPIRALTVMYSNILQIITLEGNGIEKFADLKGKRVSTGSPGSGTEIFAFRLIEAAGLDKDKDMKRERLGAAESANALKDGKVDAFFFVAGVPTSAITDVAATPNMKMKIIDCDFLVNKVREKYGPVYDTIVIKAGSYPNQTTDAKSAAVWNIMAVTDKTPDELAYTLTKTMLEKVDDLSKVHKEALNIKIENQKSAKAGIPWHPGALKYFKEKGIKVD